MNDASSIISRMDLAFGASAADKPLSLKPSAMTVFVGPNNSGKSLALREIELCGSSVGPPGQPLRIVREIESPDITTHDVLEAALASASIHSSDGAYTFLLPFGNTALNKGQSQSVVGNRDAVRAALFRAFAVRLDGQTRLALADPKQMGNMLGRPLHFLDVLFRDDATRARFRKVVHESVGSYPVLDPTTPGHLGIRMSVRAPGEAREERSLDDPALAFHSAATPIMEQSDGVRAFVGLIGFVFACRQRVLLIDEPDAFLHPPLARRLGTELALLAHQRHAQVFASTHSASFVMGAATAGVPVQIVRFTHRDGTATARLLDTSELRDLTRNALMRNSHALEAIFHEGAIVAEAAGDSVFYDEINQRLCARGDGVASCLFLNAQNKQTVERMIGPLRSLGVPAAAVVDIDVLKPSGADWTRLMRAARMPEGLVNASAALRSRVWGFLEKSGRNPKRDGGITLLSGEERREADELLGQLAAYGVFVVPKGELQSWLANLGVSQSLPSTPWLLEMLDALRYDPSEPDYVKPSDDDVWDFIRNIAKWIALPNRKGM